MQVTEKFINRWFNSWYKNDDIPVLILKKHNDYIDFLNFEDVPCPIMKGTDMSGRPFLILKVLINNEKILQVFFKRYSFYNDTLWMGCGHLTNCFLNTIGGMTKVQFDLISDIITNKNPILKNYHKCLKPEFIDKQIFLYSHIKINAVNKIKKQWSICRYDPEYIMCEKVQTRNLELLGIVF